VPNNNIIRYSRDNHQSNLINGYKRFPLPTSIIKEKEHEKVKNLREIQINPLEIAFTLPFSSNKNFHEKIRRNKKIMELQLYLMDSVPLSLIISIILHNLLGIQCLL